MHRRFFLGGSTQRGATAAQQALLLVYEPFWGPKKGAGKGMLADLAGFGSLLFDQQV